MNKEWVLTQEAFDAMLVWLDTDRDRAGKKYEAIRHRLIKIFTCRGCKDAEIMADKTIDRVAKKAPDLAQSYSGDPALYFYGVANNVHLEYLRKKQPQALPPTLVAQQPDDVEQEYQCLERCMERLPSDNRDLVLQYYSEDKQAKIDHRKLLAGRLGVALGALRLRAFRIRQTLHECVSNCIEQTRANEIA